MAWTEQKFSGSPGATNGTSIDKIFAQSPTTKEVTKIEFDDLPAPFTYRWKQAFDLPTGKYKFSVLSDDGIRLYVNGIIKIDAWKDQPPTEYSTIVDVQNSPTIITIEYYNDRGLGVAKFNYVKVDESQILTVFDDTGIGPAPPLPPTSIVTPQTSIPAPIIQTTVPNTTSVDLQNIVSFNKLYTERSYVKGTLSTIQEDVIVVKNNSNILTTYVSFAAVSGVTFTPSTITLTPGEQSSVKITFNPSIIDTFREGITDLDCVVSISSNTQVTNPGSDDVRPPVVPPPPPPPPPLPPVQPPTVPPIVIPPTVPTLGIRSININPSSVNLATGGQSIKFTVSIDADAGIPTDVLWSVNTPGLVNIDSSGLLTTLDTPGSLQVIATSNFDKTKIAIASVNIIQSIVIPKNNNKPTPVTTEVPVLIDPKTGEIIVVQKGTDPISLPDAYTCTRVGEITREYTDYNTGRLIRCTVEQDSSGGCVEICREYGEVEEYLKNVFGKNTNNGINPDPFVPGTVVSITKVQNYTNVTRGKQTITINEF